MTGDVSNLGPITEAVKALLAGRLVAVPTETVYGLAADATSAQAVAEIYRTKGRPDFNPLICHIPNLQAARALAVFGAAAEQLANRFWPGPLTMVLPKTEGCPVAPAVTAGLDTIAVRCPAHPMMRALLESSGLVLAAPSANRSGGISPTTAEHVRRSLGSGAPKILDGGACEAGLESSIVVVRDDGWRILRPGPITEAQIAELLGPPLAADANEGITAPGQLASHYAPSKPVALNVIEAEPDQFHIGFGDIAGDANLSDSGDLAEAAARLFALLHQADESPAPRIAITPVPHRDIGIAINDRLKRASV